MTARPHCLAARPEFGSIFETAQYPAFADRSFGQPGYGCDPLSDLLKTVRLTGAVFFEIVAEDPWAVGSPAREQILPKILPGADHLIAYHVVTTGRCFATAVGGQAIALEAGQVVVFTNGQPHIMSSGPNMPADPPMPDVLEVAASGKKPFCINFGSGAAWSNLSADIWPATHGPTILCLRISARDDRRRSAQQQRG